MVLEGRRHLEITLFQLVANVAKKTVAVLEGVMNFQLLKDILHSLKKEVDRWLIMLKMVLELNGAWNVELREEGISKDPNFKALVVPFVGKDNMGMGCKDIGLHNLKGEGPGMFRRVDTVNDGGEAHFKAFEHGSSKVVVYGRRPKPRYSVQWRVKMGVPCSMVGTRQSMETEAVKFVYVTDGIDIASGSFGCSITGET